MAASTGVTVAAIGLDHRHIYGMTGSMIRAGARARCWWTDGRPDTVDGFVSRFPDIPEVADRQAILDDPGIDMVLIASVPDTRAAFALEAMEAGKDVMVDKPGAISLAEVEALTECAARTGRIWTVDFSERFEVPAVTRAAELVAEGAIGRVVQTVGLGPHRLNRATRPDWFWNARRFGGILTDIASHQIDQFLYFTGSTDAEIVASSVGNFALPNDPAFEDFGEVVLRSPNGHGYIRVDWYTPDALPNWGDGRLTILGTEGYIELRKYVDVAGRDGTDHLFLVNGSRCEYINCKEAPLPYFPRLIDDVLHRTETAVPQAHTFTVTRLAIEAQERAVRTGLLAGKSADRPDIRN
jgi:predicted dehydrogenase